MSLPFPLTGGCSNAPHPIGISATNPRYLSFRGKSKVYVGWSADVACHFKLNNPDNCHSGVDANPPQAAIPANYPALLTALRGSAATLEQVGFSQKEYFAIAGPTNNACQGPPGA